MSMRTRSVPLEGTTNLASDAEVCPAFRERTFGGIVLSTRRRPKVLQILRTFYKSFEGTTNLASVR